MDSRITNQPEYLSGVSLTRRVWSQPAPRWDHDHCAFCWAKFAGSDIPGAIQEGYATLDGDHWVCDACFQDFRIPFGWSVV